MCGMTICRPPASVVRFPRSVLAVAARRRVSSAVRRSRRIPSAVLSLLSRFHFVIMVGWLHHD